MLEKETSLSPADVNLRYFQSTVKCAESTNGAKDTAPQSPPLGWQ
jgi:hypothetical protein